MHIGIQALGVIDTAPETAGDLGFKAVSEAGFESVDFSFEAFYDTRSVSDSSIPCFYDMPVDELKSFFEPYVQQCSDGGLKFCQSHAPFLNFIDEKNAWAHYIEIEKKTIELAGFIGSPYIVVHPVITSGRYDKQNELQLNREFFRELAPSAKTSGVKLCIENLFYYSDGAVKKCALSEPRDMSAFIEELNSESDEDVFKFCLDLGHATLLKQDIRHVINTMAESLVITHLHDNNGDRDLHAFPYTNIQNWGGSFSVDWDSFICAMRDIHYEGTLSFETAGIMLVLPEELKKAAMCYTAAVGRYLKNKIIS